MRAVCGRARRAIWACAVSVSLWSYETSYAHLRLWKERKADCKYEGGNKLEGDRKAPADVYAMRIIPERNSVSNPARHQLPPTEGARTGWENTRSHPPGRQRSRYGSLRQTGLAVSREQSRYDVSQSALVQNAHQRAPDRATNLWYRGTLVETMATPIPAIILPAMIMA